MLILRTPTQMQLQGYGPRHAQLAKTLHYVDKKVDWTLRKFKSSKTWFLKGKIAKLQKEQGLDLVTAASSAQAEFDARIAELQELRNKTILFEDVQGLWTYSGVRPLLASEFDDNEVRREYDLPGSRLIPWAHPPDRDPRYYQEAAADALLKAAHFGPAGVEMGTGLGKTFILELLLKRLGLQAVVMTPSKSIGRQIYDELVHFFGKAKVGYYGDGKKEFNKLFTVGIGASLTKIDPESPAWAALSQAKVFIADESHMCPASTLAKVCFGLVSNAPYRFFFSGTQLRNDGLDLLLDGITGPIVYKMTVQEGVDQGFLAKPIFRMCWTTSQMPCSSSDANEQTRAHVYYNPVLNQKVAEIANKAVSVMGRPTLVLVEELEQISHLLPYLRFEAQFAHGGVTKDNKDKIPPQFHSSDTAQLVDAFNAGKFPILVGTSCVATGTDIKANQATIYLRGGMSEIEVRQGAAGRSTRLHPGKTDCVVFDVGISNVETLKRHAEARRDIYRDIYPSYTEIKI